MTLSNRCLFSVFSLIVSSEGRDVGRGAHVDGRARARGPLPRARDADPAAAQLPLPRDAEDTLAHCGRTLRSAVPVCGK